MLRKALSLTEVLISMGILTLGLLGVASVFPVASFYMQKADNYDISSTLAQSAMNELVTRGLLDPKAWYVMSPAPASGTVGDPNYTFQGIDGAYAPHTTKTTPQPSSFTRPLVEAMKAGEPMVRDISLFKPAQWPGILAKQFGHAYIIDPIGIAAVQARQGVNPTGRIMYGFPSASFMAYAGTGGGYYSTSAWDAWRANTKSPNNPQQMTWPIRRVTFRQSSTGWNLDKRMAEHYFAWQEDLAYDFPPRDDRPSIQSLDIGPAGNPLSRQWKGDYSWIASVVPSTDDSRDLIATSPGSALCELSVVVLYKRVLPSDNLVSGTDYAEAAMPERSVGVSIVSTGLNGGELLLRDLGDGVSSAFTNLKSSQYIMLCGPHPNSSTSAPRFFLNWYQVVSIESNTNAIITDSNKQRIVTVRGPEWPWQPAPTNPHDYTQLSNDLCVGIIKGAIAVHSKSVALQNSAGAGLPSFGSIGAPKDTNEHNQPF